MFQKIKPQNLCEKINLNITNELTVPAENVRKPWIPLSLMNIVSLPHFWITSSSGFEIIWAFLKYDFRFLVSFSNFSLFLGYHYYFHFYKSNKYCVTKRNIATMKNIDNNLVNFCHNHNHYTSQCSLVQELISPIKLFFKNCFFPPTSVDDNKNIPTQKHFQTYSYSQ